MGTANPVHRLSEAEYLEIERKAEFKSEFFDGEMFAMAGGSPEHSIISINLTSELRSKLKGKPCITFDKDLRVKIEATGLYTYPDASVVCGPRLFAPGTTDVLINPTMVGEVLSPSTEGYDRGKKFENYRRIPSLREYLLISQHAPHVELFVRHDAQWQLQEASGLDSNIHLPVLDITLALSEIFANVEFK